MADISEHKYLFHKGKNYRSYEIFGPHMSRNKKSCIFRVWAPGAKSVSLVGEFNNWDINADIMTPLSDDDTIFEIKCTKAKIGDQYKYAITTKDGKVLYKADPYAFYSERPDLEGSMKASRVWDIAKPFKWTDAAWLKQRASSDPYHSPMNIYEVHLGSWRRKDDGSFLSYKETADKLIPYVKKMGYTHIELLPVMEHPFEGSWGYQITGYYSITSRYGDPEAFKYLVNLAHANGIGVLLDWVPAHFPKDAFGLAEFAGEPLYEYTDPYKKEHKGWGTLAFDFGRPEVISFLVSNAFFYCDQYHADGLRVDAVAAMLYLNYDRPDGQWAPNEDGGVENKEAVKFLQSVNSDVLSNFPGVIMIAEESTAWPNVTWPPHDGGLGFNFKWNMGWMNDTLEYFGTDPYFRSYIHNKLTFAMSYAHSENFILPISHDEVVHGKKSLLDKMPGDYDRKFAGMRAFMVYMMTHPGKKLNFMGSEFGQFIEWNEKQALDWLLLDYDRHAAMQKFIAKLNKYYLDTPALWSEEGSFDCFSWIDADNSSDNVYSYFRSEKPKDTDDITLVVLNLSGRGFEEYNIGVPQGGSFKCIINTDDAAYGGAGGRTSKLKNYKPIKGECNGYGQYITISLPAMSAVILERKSVKNDC